MHLDGAEDMMNREPLFFCALSQARLSIKTPSANHIFQLTGLNVYVCLF